MESSTARVPQPSMLKVQLEQSKDKELVQLISFLTDKSLPDDPREAKVVLERDTMWWMESSTMKEQMYQTDDALWYQNT